jgi:hypothetical protein
MSRDAPGSIRSRDVPAPFVLRFLRPYTSAELAPDTVSAWQELRHTLETRRHQRTQRRCFRRDPASYLATLEADLLKLLLPP